MCFVIEVFICAAELILAEWERTALSFADRKLDSVFAFFHNGNLLCPLASREVTLDHYQDGL